MVHKYNDDSQEKNESQGTVAATKTAGNEGRVEMVTAATSLRFLSSSHRWEPLEPHRVLNSDKCETPSKVLRRSDKLCYARIFCSVPRQ